MPQFDQKQLSYEELQVAVMLLLEKAKLKPADKNQLRFATVQCRAGEVDLKYRLAKLLSETVLEREQRKDSPRRLD